MLLEFAQWLARDIRAFSVFNYITLRAVLAAMTALLIGLIFGPLVIRKLAEMKIGQAVRTDGPKTHLGKSGTPTMGGALIQHIPDTIPDALAHEQPNPRDEPGHEIAVGPDTLLARIVGVARMAVNSSHHQAVASAGPGGLVSAVAPDGVVEAVEYPAHRFALGVQWHPEYAVDPRDPAIFQAFDAAARG